MKLNSQSFKTLNTKENMSTSIFLTFIKMFSASEVSFKIGYIFGIFCIFVRWTKITGSDRFSTRERPRCGSRNGLICLTFILNDDCMVACGILGIFMKRKVLGSLLKVSRDSTKPTKIVAEQENNFAKNVKNVIPPLSYLKATLNEYI